MPKFLKKVTQRDNKGESNPGQALKMKIIASDNLANSQANVKLHWTEKWYKRSVATMRRKYGVEPIGNSLPGVNFFSYQDALTMPEFDGSLRTQHHIAWQLIMGIIPFVTKDQIEMMSINGTPYGAEDVKSRLSVNSTNSDGTSGDGVNKHIIKSWEAAHGNMSRVMAKHDGPTSEALGDINGWQAREEICDLLERSGWPLSDIEREQKFGPCDRRGWSALQEKLIGQFTVNKVNPNERLLHLSALRVVKELLDANGGEKFKAFSVRESFVRVGNNTSFATGAGYYTFVNSSRLSADVWDTHLQWAEKIRRCEVHPYMPGECGTRSQAGRMDGDGKYLSKTRLVVADPKCVQIAAGTLMYPKLDIMQTMPQYMALAGNETIINDELVMMPLKTAFAGASIDYENFDSTLKMLLHSWWSKYEPLLWSSEETEFCEWYAMNHVFAPIIAEYGCFFSENGHGLFSGKIDTNITGSILNRWAALYQLMRILVDDGEEYSDEELSCILDIACEEMLFHMAMGDDTLMFFKNKEHIEELTGRKYTHDDFSVHTLAKYASELGLKMSTDVNKVHAFTDEDNVIIASFLSRYYYLDKERGIELNNVASFIRVLSSLVFPENYIIEEECAKAVREPINWPYDPDAKTLKRQSVKVGWLTNPTVVGPIMLKWWSTISNLFNNPSYETQIFLTYVMERAPHNFNPTMMVKVENIMYYLMMYGSHVNFDAVRESGIESTGIFGLMVDVFDSIPHKRVEHVPSFDWDLKVLAKKADQADANKTNYARSKRVDDEKQDMMEMLSELLNNGSIQSRLHDDIMRHLT